MQLFSEPGDRDHERTAGDVFQLHDLDERGRFGVMHTPALVITGKVKCAGLLPSRAMVEEWLRGNSHQ